MRLSALPLLLAVSFLAACGKPENPVPVTDTTTNVKVSGSLLRIDSSFAPGAGFSCEADYPNVLGIYPAPDGKVYVTTPESSTYQGIPVSPVCRINADGTLDGSFSARASFAGDGGRIYDLKTLTDGRLAVVGTFRLRDDQGSYNVAVLNPDGSLDPQFRRTGPGAAGPGLYAVVEDAVGRLVTGGNFSTVDGVPTSKNLVAFKRDGAVDSTLKWPDVNGTINSIVRTSTGLWIGGEFTKVGGESSTHVALLAADGSLQQAVTPLQNIGRSEGGVRKLIPTPDGKMYAVGAFTYTRSGVVIRNLARFASGGQLDADFKYNNTLASVASNRILCGAVTSAGNLVVGGDFPNESGGNIGMVNPDGNLDKRMLAVDGGTGEGAQFVNGIYIDAAKRIYLVGYFSYLEKKDAPGIVRLVGGD